jgi:hypothetical protein
MSIKNMEFEETAAKIDEIGGYIHEEDDESFCSS